MSRRVCFVVVGTLVTLFGAHDTWAQGIGAASIVGVVRDVSGAVLPGVTVEAASPVLIEKVRNTVTDGEGRYQIAELVSEADRVQWHDKHFRRELAAWLTPNRSARRDGIPGYARGVGNIISDAEAFVVRTFDLGEGQAARDREIALHSPVIAVLSAQNDSRLDWLNAGMALSDVLLRARVEDVSASFLKPGRGSSAHSSEPGGFAEWEGARSGAAASRLRKRDQVHSASSGSRLSAATAQPPDPHRQIARRRRILTLNPEEL